MIIIFCFNTLSKCLSFLMFIMMFSFFLVCVIARSWWSFAFNFKLIILLTFYTCANVTFLCLSLFVHLFWCKCQQTYVPMYDLACFLAFLLCSICCPLFFMFWLYVHVGQCPSSFLWCLLCFIIIISIISLLFCLFLCKY